MNVILVGNYRHDRQESMQRFAALLASELPHRGVNVEFLRPKAFFGCIKPAVSGAGKWLGYVDKFCIFPVLLRKRLRHLRTEQRLRALRRNESKAGLPIVHICDHSNAPYVRYLSKVPHVVTVHDLLAVRSALGEFAENATRWSGRILQSMIQSGLQQCGAAACISEATQADLFRLAGRTTANTTVIPNGLNYSYSPVSPADAESLLAVLFARLGATRPGRYILHVGGNEWYKNRRGCCVRSAP